MKKFITLVLVLVLALGLTVPAMAFTSDSDADDDSIPYDLKVYLVEYDDNDLFGIATLPESDRGYAKNEVVAAIIELDVPEDEDVYGDGYRSLNISGDNVSFDVTDNVLTDLSHRTSGAPQLDWKTKHKDGMTLTITNSPKNLPDDETYKWLVFAKVTDDEASITAKLIDGTEADEFAGSPSHLHLTLEGQNYTVYKDETSDGYEYEILWTDDGTDYGILIETDDDYVSTGMYIGIDDGHDYDGTYFPLGVNTKNELGLVKGAIIDTDGDDYDDVMDVYNDVVVDVFGMDYFLIGNYVRDSFFEDLTSSDTLVATVDIEPWTAYVTVPDNIVVDPPKTGDAASIMGFVMVALSGAGVVALRKRG